LINKMNKLAERSGARRGPAPCSRGGGTGLRPRWDPATPTPLSLPQGAEHPSTRSWEREASPSHAGVLPCVPH